MSPAGIEPPQALPGGSHSPAPLISHVMLTRKQQHDSVRKRSVRTLRSAPIHEPKTLNPKPSNKHQTLNVRQPSSELGTPPPKMPSAGYRGGTEHDLKSALVPAHADTHTAAEPFLLFPNCCLPVRYLRRGLKPCVRPCCRQHEAERAGGLSGASRNG